MDIPKQRSPHLQRLSVSTGDANCRRKADTKSQRKPSIKNLYHPVSSPHHNDVTITSHVHQLSPDDCLDAFNRQVDIPKQRSPQSEDQNSASRDYNDHHHSFQDFYSTIVHVTDEPTIFHQQPTIITKGLTYIPFGMRNSFHTKPYFSSGGGSYSTSGAEMHDVLPETKNKSTTYKLQPSKHKKVCRIS